MDLRDLAASLLGEEAQATIARENPYFQFAQVPQAFTQGILAVKPKSRAEMWQGAMAAGLSNLVGGALQGVGQSHQNTLSERYTRALMGGGSEGLSPGLFGAAQRGAALFDMARAAGLQDDKDKSDATVKLQERLIDVGAKKRLAEILAEDQAWRTASEGRGGRAAPVAVVTEPSAGQVDDSLIRPVGNPNNPYFVDEVKAVERRQDLSEKIRKEFNALPEVKNFSITSKGAAIVAKAVKDPSAVADQELVRYAILMIEPGMAVREGEQRAVAASQSIPDEWRGYLSKALSGKGALQQQVREGILRLAARSYEAHKGQYEQALGFYKNRAAEIGLNPTNLSYLGDAPSVDSLMGKPSLSLEMGGKNAVDGYESKEKPPPPKAGKRRFWNGKSWEYK